MGHCLRVLERFWWASNGRNIAVPFFFVPQKEGRVAYDVRCLFFFVVDDFRLGKRTTLGERKVKNYKSFVIAILSIISMVSICQAGIGEWVRQSDSPVLDTGGPSPYESYHVQQPSVIIEDGVYKMWYTGYRGGPSPRTGICYATSTDKGLTWTKHGTVLEVTEEWERNTPPETYNYINHPRVVYEDGVYKMWYTAGGSLGYTTSVDGVNWGVKTQQLGLGSPYNDIVKGPSDYKLYYSKSGAIYVMESSDGGVSDPWEVANEDDPILMPGDSGDWDSSGISTPNVRYEPQTGKFQMWYYGNSTSGAPSIGFALSDDGLTWEKDITNPLLEPVPGTWESGWVIPGSVVFDSNDSMYRMFYGGYHFDHWAIGLAAAVCEPTTLLPLIDIDPDTLNRKSHGKWITVYITLPEGFDVGTIDTSSIAITSLIGASCDPEYTQGADLGFTPQVGDRDEDGILDLTVKFDRQVLLANLCLDDVSITIEGELTTGELFSRSDSIRIIDRGK